MILPVKVDSGVLGPLQDLLAGTATPSDTAAVNDLYQRLTAAFQSVEPSIGSIVMLDDGSLWAHAQKGGRWVCLTSDAVQTALWGALLARNPTVIFQYAGALNPT